jgi:hypothetical protein
LGVWQALQRGLMALFLLSLKGNPTRFMMAKMGLEQVGARLACAALGKGRGARAPHSARLVLVVSSRLRAACSGARRRRLGMRVSTVEILACQGLATAA